MCGIAGSWKPGADQSSVDIGQRMAAVLHHRGPDDGDVWVDESLGLMLAHRRLAVIDQSAAGHQPMQSGCGRYTISYNGEIYNHLDIRSELEASGHAPEWRGHSDTETLLASLAAWGCPATLKKLNGMFAFALWDQRDRCLILARDRMGEKPLYYGISKGVFLFASELKALQVHPAWEGEIDRNALAAYFRFQYVPAPRSIYQNINKLPPAHYAEIRFSSQPEIALHRYWNLSAAAQSGAGSSAQQNAAALTDSLDVLIRDSVGRRMVADVPLGAFLSGGYDSSMVVAQMAAQSNLPVKTFSIGFEDPELDEAPHARAIARHIGTDHTELYVTDRDALNTVVDLPKIWDEPFADSSQIPTLLISHMAREHVTVSLSGDGGDELFYGYGRYFQAESLQQTLAKWPLPVRQLAAAVLSHAPVAILEALARLLPSRYQVEHPSDRLPKLAPLLRLRDPALFYQEIVSHWKAPEELVRGAVEPISAFTDKANLPSLPGLAELMMYLDMISYLPDDILTKVDRASMAASLEARVPLLDHRLVEFAWQIPTSLKRSSDGGKALFRDVLYRYVPSALLDRPKKGFGVPLESWLKGPLRDWGESLLSEQKLQDAGFLDANLVRTMWQQHISGERRWHYYLWDVLMFQAWLETQRP